jgi:hypothetical protein
MGEDAQGFHQPLLIGCLLFSGIPQCASIHIYTIC